MGALGSLRKKLFSDGWYDIEFLNTYEVCFME